ncbi:MAG: ribonuclease III, partial [Nitrospirae bacterium]
MSRAPAVAQFEPLTARLGHRFRDPQLLERALTHRSFAGEHRLPPAATNERLEFLGDAVIELVVSHLLVAADPEASEGDLSRRRSRLVCREALAAAAAELGLGEHLRLGAGERRAGGAAEGSILAAAYEALVGALYLDAGLE